MISYRERELMMVQKFIKDNGNNLKAMMADASEDMKNGNPVDENALLLPEIKTYEELVAAVEQFIYYYNHQRRQHKLNCLPPATYRSLLEAA